MSSQRSEKMISTGRMFQPRISDRDRRLVAKIDALLEKFEVQDRTPQPQRVDTFSEDGYLRRQISALTTDLINARAQILQLRREQGVRMVEEREACVRIVRRISQNASVAGAETAKKIELEICARSATVNE